MNDISRAMGKSGLKKPADAMKSGLKAGLIGG